MPRSRRWPADRAAALRAGRRARAPCRRSGGVRRRRHARGRARRGRADRGRLPAAAGGGRRAGGAARRRAAIVGRGAGQSRLPLREGRRRGGGAAMAGRRTSSRSSWSTTGSSSSRSNRAPRSGATMRRADSFDLLLTGQGVHSLRNQLAEAVFHVPLERIRVHAPDVGGGFGVKNFLYPEWVLVLWAARRLGRPVRWVADRGEEFLSSAQGRDNTRGAASALDADGKFLALEVEMVANLGAYLSTNGPGSSTKSPLDRAGRRLRHSGDVHERARRLHQHGADRRLSRRRQARGQLHHRAAGRAGGAAARDRAGRAAPAQPDARFSVSRRRSA